MPSLYNREPTADDPLPKAMSGFLHYAGMLLGTLAIGAILPSGLVALRVMDKTRENIAWTFVENVAGLTMLAAIFCGPGAIFLSLVLHYLLRRYGQSWNIRRVMWVGALGGAAMAFLNLPGYWVLAIVPKDTFVFGRVALLFAVAGASCGLWIAWQAWRTWHPGEQFLPRFSLQTLMLLVLIWGAVLLAFQPRQTLAP